MISIRFHGDAQFLQISRIAVDQVPAILQNSVQLANLPSDMSGFGGHGCAGLGLPGVELQTDGIITCK